MTYPIDRLSRMRVNRAMRAITREHRVTADDLIFPIFVVPGEGVHGEIASMPGQFRHSVDRLPALAERVDAVGVRSVILFGVPARKDNVATGAFSEKGIIQQAVKAIKSAVPELVVMVDTCLCEYTADGQCFIFTEGSPDHAATLETLARTAVSQAAAGADVIAPSGMVDGMVRAIRQDLDIAGYADVAIMSYAAKYASAFYGPFRDAVDSAPAETKGYSDRAWHQMDPPNAREAMREAELDADEGADILMVKPGMSYLDVLYRMRQRFDHPLAAYQVSGEYAMIKAAVANGWLDEERAITESLVAFKRAGADMILTYFALEALEKTLIF